MDYKNGKYESFFLLYKICNKFTPNTKKKSWPSHFPVFENKSRGTIFSFVEFFLCLHCLATQNISIKVVHLDLF